MQRLIKSEMLNTKKDLPVLGKKIIKQEKIGIIPIWECASYII